MRKYLAILAVILVSSAPVWALDDLIVNGGGTVVTITGTASYRSIYIGTTSTNEEWRYSSGYGVNLPYEDPNLGTNGNELWIDGGVVSAVAATGDDLSGWVHLVGSGGYADIGYPYGDNNKLIVTNGGILNIDKRYQVAQDYDFYPWQTTGWPPVPYNPLLQNNLLEVRDGGTINAADRLRINAGNVHISGGIINSPMFYSWSQSGTFIGSEGSLRLNYGTVNTSIFGMGYSSFAYIGDGHSGEPMLVYIAPGGYLQCWAGYMSPYIPGGRDPLVPGSPVMPWGVNALIKGNAIVRGTMDLWATEDSMAMGYLVEGGGQIDPAGDIDNASPGTVAVQEGWLSFESNAILDIDLFSWVSADALTAPVAGTVVKTNADPNFDSAIMHVRSQGYTPTIGDAWVVVQTNAASLTGLGFRVIPADRGVTYDFSYDSGLGIGTLSVTDYIPDVLDGDANYDNAVDAFDLLILQNNYEQPGFYSWVDGDFNGDMIVDAFDLLILQNGWTEPTLGLSQVPEPATMALLGLGGLALLRRRR